MVSKVKGLWLLPLTVQHGNVIGILQCFYFRYVSSAMRSWTMHTEGTKLSEISKAEISLCIRYRSKNFRTKTPLSYKAEYLQPMNSSNVTGAHFPSPCCLGGVQERTVGSVGESGVFLNI